jgi:hypothetical protein
MVKVAPPSVTLTFQGRRDWSLAQEIDDWGLTPTQQVHRGRAVARSAVAVCSHACICTPRALHRPQETYVEQFRRILDAKKAWREEVHGERGAH